MRRSFKVHVLRANTQRQRSEVTMSQYEALGKQGRGNMLTVYGLMASGGGAVPLVFAELDDWAVRP